MKVIKRRGSSATGQRHGTMHGRTTTRRMMKAGAYLRNAKSKPGSSWRRGKRP